VNQLFSLFLSLSTLLCCSIFSDGQNAEFTHVSQNNTTPLTVVVLTVSENEDENVLPTTNETHP